MIDHNNDDHIHVTETFGARVLDPQALVMVFRIRQTEERVHELTVNRAKYVDTIVRWMNRWSMKRGVVFSNPAISMVGGPKSAGVLPDAMAAVAIVFQVPNDWRCWSALIGNTVSPDFPDRLELPKEILDALGVFDLPSVEDEKKEPIN